jgi:hypothetical protein
MFQVRNRHTKQIAQLLRNGKEINDILGLFAEVLVDAQSGACIHMRHLEIMFEDVDNAFVHCLEEHEEVLCEETEGGDGEVVFEIVEVELSSDDQLR